MIATARTVRVPLTLDTARSMLERRDRAFVERDIDAYLELWAVDARVEGPSHSIEGHAELRRSIERAWHSWQPVYMGFTSLGVSGWLMHHEFVAVWEKTGQTLRRLVTGVGVAEVDRSGRWIWMREYLDPSGTERPSVMSRPEISELEPEDGFDTSTP
jgi:hypothetical protein